MSGGGFAADGDLTLGGSFWSLDVVGCRWMSLDVVVIQTIQLNWAHLLGVTMGCHDICSMYGSRSYLQV